jgi:hypothetical protein
LGSRPNGAESIVHRHGLQGPTSLLGCTLLRNGPQDMGRQDGSNRTAMTEKTTIQFLFHRSPSCLCLVLPAMPGQQKELINEDQKAWLPYSENQAFVLQLPSSLNQLIIFAQSRQPSESRYIHFIRNLNDRFIWINSKRGAEVQYILPTDLMDIFHTKRKFNQSYCRFFPAGGGKTLRKGPKR